MSSIATINVRLPENLKRNGGQVLERNSVSPSELVRSVYRYMEEKQSIPECLDLAKADDGSTDPRRILLRKVSGTLDFEEAVDAKEVRAQRIEAKYGYLL